MKIYTKTGDSGKTSLLSGNRVSKNHIRIETYGAIDELSSFIGYLRGHEIPQTIHEQLVFVQTKLFDIASLLSDDDGKYSAKLPQIKENDINKLEKDIDEIIKSLPELKNFILPGGNKIVGLAHICRTVCRRAERLTVTLSEENKIDENILTFLNRLSDYFFALSRKLAQTQNFEQLKA